jgi:hypothetical protein
MLDMDVTENAELIFFYSPSPEYPAARAAQALAPRVLQG